MKVQQTSVRSALAALVSAALLASPALAAGGSVTGFVGQSFLGEASTDTAIAVQPTSSTGYVAELRYPGVYLLDGNSGGYCGRAQRYTYTQ